MLASTTTALRHFRNGSDAGKHTCKNNKQKHAEKIPLRKFSAPGSTTRFNAASPLSVPPLFLIVPYIRCLIASSYRLTSPKRCDQLDSRSAQMSELPHPEIRRSLVRIPATDRILFLDSETTFSRKHRAGLPCGSLLQYGWVAVSPIIGFPTRPCLSQN